MFNNRDLSLDRFLGKGVAASSITTVIWGSRGGGFLEICRNVERNKSATVCTVLIGSSSATSAHHTVFPNHIVLLGTPSCFVIYAICGNFIESCKLQTRENTPSRNMNQCRVYIRTMRAVEDFPNYTYSRCSRVNRLYPTEGHFETLQKTVLLRPPQAIFVEVTLF